MRRKNSISAIIFIWLYFVAISLRHTMQINTCSTNWMFDELKSPQQIWTSSNKSSSIHIGFNSTHFVPFWKSAVLSRFVSL